MGDGPGMLPQAPVEDMRRIPGDDLSLTALESRDRLQRVKPENAKARALRDLIVDWSGRLSPDSVEAAAEAAMRWQLATLVVERSGLGDTTKDYVLQVPPPVVPANQIWWALPALLRSDDERLLNGIGWSEALDIALTRAAATFEPKPWGEIHRTRLAHPLSGLFPAAAAKLEPPGAGVGGDNDTVWATGAYAATGLDACYGAIARYVFDVGAWENCQWVIFHGASGQPGSPHYMDQHAAWADLQLVPMLYDCPRIMAAGTTLTLP